MKKRILYITFINMEDAASSGSSVRPKRMLDAFIKLGCKVDLISGRGNKRKERKEAFSKAILAINSNEIDLCYIEPPAGPLFFRCDRKLLKIIQRKGIPIGLFYRDAYWKFPEYQKSYKSFDMKQILKLGIIKIMQKRDWIILKKYCKIIYFPTALMSSYFICDNKGALPPGCFIPSYVEQTNSTSIPVAIYIGGATVDYGLPLLIESASKINNKKINLKIIIVCSIKQWESFTMNYDFNMLEQYNWLEIKHLSGDDELAGIYQKADFAIIPRLKNIYHDFAFPVKLVEYLSYNLPIVATNCTETQKFIEKFEVGLVAKDDVEDFSEKLNEMAVNVDLRKQFKLSCFNARNENLWEKRAENIITDLIIRQ